MSEKVIPFTKEMHDTLVSDSFEQDFLNKSNQRNFNNNKMDIAEKVAKSTMKKFKRDSFTCTPLTPYDPALNQFENYALFKKIIGGIKKAAKAVGKGVTTAVKAVGQGVKFVAKEVVAPVAGLVVFSPLIPFIPAMNNGIEKVGLTPEKDMGKKVEQFYRYVIKKEKINGFESDYFLTDVAGAVKEIFTFLTTAIGKKKNNVPMTIPEKAVADLATMAKAQLILDVSKEKATTTEQVVNDAKKLATEITDENSILNESSPRPVIESVLVPLKKSTTKTTEKKGSFFDSTMNKIIVAAIGAIILGIILYFIFKK